ncbi:MAG: VanW family protein [Clostridium sp.]|uniref:VanW family protein n=1 Tax=Clostridium sp. TaxID=1506 RepID=UPI00304E8360
MENNKASKIEALKLAFKKNQKPLLIATAVIVIIIASAAAYIYSVNNKIVSWENKVYPGVEVYGVSLGGLDKETGLKVIEEQLIPKINEKKIKITVGDKVNEISYADIAPSYDANSILDEAMAFGKDKGLFDKKSLIDNETKQELTPNVAYDDELLRSKEAEIRKAVDVNPVDAKIVINGTTPSVTEEVLGYTIDAEDFHNKIVESISGNPLESSELTFELKETAARIKASDLNKIDSKISTFSTNYRRGSDLGRDKNMEVAAGYINGTVLMPGDVFSYYDKIGQTTPEKGYEKANVYVADRIEKDYGGGVCQISTTLYRAAMGANLRSVERRNHSMTVSYAELGLDATYASGYIDYKFKNEYDFPVYIQGSVTGNQVIFSIFGNQEGMGGKTYKMASEVLETYQPKVVKKDDPNLYVGEERVTQAGMVGHKVKSYQITYENGQEVNREYIATDVYNTQDRIISVGTKPKPEAPVVPAE